ncbi:MAG TPA: helix-turn-helix transcriptional regulator [Candidatus Binatia bacterium]|nr:helix-turn-helix transcriptional regulator [Candidatus Binatia bacterium]
MVGRPLVSAAEPAPGQLSPRLRQTLACLVEGDTEKQVAARLGVSPTTAHEYVTALYRRFGTARGTPGLAPLCTLAVSLPDRRPPWR